MPRHGPRGNPHAKKRKPKTMAKKRIKVMRRR